MSKRLFTLSIISLLGILLNACAPSAVAPAPTSTYTALPLPTLTASPEPTPTQTPEPTPTAPPRLTPTETSAVDAAATIRVPADAPTIQAGIDAAPDGGIVLVSPGTYTENVTIANKSITLASLFLTTGDEQYISDTIIDGQRQAVVTVAKTAGTETRVIGLTIQNGDDGIKARAWLEVRNNRFLNNKDGLDYQDCGGLNSGNLYENNTDDGIDLDGSSEAIIENNIIRNNRDDGIEIRLHEHAGPTLTIVIRHNWITGNREDGIQLIDYPDVSDRIIHIEHNFIQGNKMTGLGLMDDGQSEQDFRAASIPERIFVLNNTFVDNPYAVSGGDNLIALNNIFSNSTTLGLKNVDGNSIVAYNLFWNNAVDSEGSNIDGESTLYAFPSLDDKFRPDVGSPVIDAGAALFEWNGETLLDLPADAFFGSAPDLGAFESESAQASRQSPRSLAVFQREVRDHD